MRKHFGHGEVSKYSPSTRRVDSPDKLEI